MASIKLITFTDKVGINKIIAAKIHIKTLTTIVEAFIEGIIKDR